MAARLTVLVLACAAGVAAAETRPDYGGDVVATLTSEPGSLDPVRARSHAEVTVAGLLFDTLYRTTGDGAVVPHLAAAPPEVKGGRARIALRPGVRFHDGSALGADDVAGSLERLQDSDARWLLASVTSIEADGDALVLGLRGDGAELAALLAAPQAAITPDGHAPRSKPIGSGPFRFDAIDRKKRRVVLVASDDHFAGRPYVDRLELRWFDTPDGETRAFEDGTLHVSARGATVFAGAAPKYRSDVAEAPATLLTFVGFGRAHAKVTRDRDFRRALHLAISRGGLSSSGRGERVVPTMDPIPADLGGESLGGDAGGGDTAAAAKALARAADRVPELAASRRSRLSLEILVDKTRLDDREVAERVVRALDKLGIAATITEAGAQELPALLGKGVGDLWIGQLAAPGASPGVLWGAVFAAGGETWDGGADARADFADRLPILPLLHRSVRVHHRSDLRGIMFDASARLCFADLFFFGEPSRSRKKAR